MKKTLLLSVVSLMFVHSVGLSQTNPTVFNLASSGNYLFNNWPAASPAGTYPANMVFHVMANANPTLATVAGPNVTGVYNSGVANTTKMMGLGAGGFSFKNSNSAFVTGYTAINRCGEAVLALNTVDRTNIQVSFTAGEIGTAPTSICAITCQYRITTAGVWTALPGASSLWEYRSDDPSASVAFAPITLPASCDNQPVIQLRWVYNYISGAGSPKPELSVTDISVTSVPLVTISALPGVCPSDGAFVLSDGAPVSSGLGTGVYTSSPAPGAITGNVFDPAVSGTGTFTITYTYTDVNGISNFVSSPMIVDPSYCVTSTSLSAASCGATGLTLNSIIYCEPVVGATNYEYSFSAPAFSTTKLKNTGAPNLGLEFVPGLVYGTTYTVTVKAFVAGTWGAYGSPCTIALMALPATKLNATSCGATGLTMASNIYAVPVSGATDYEYTFVNGGTITKLKGSNANNLLLSSVAGLQYGLTYDVTVKAKVNNVWSALGVMCNITLSAIPSPTLKPASCGATGLTMASGIDITAIPGASDYEYTFDNGTTTISKLRGSSSTNIILSSVAGLQYGSTYTVTVKAKSNNVLGAAGAPCSITLIAMPTTKLASASCNAGGLTKTSLIYCDAVAGATNYEYTITNTQLNYSNVKQRGAGIANIGLGSFSGLLLGNTYMVTVKAYVGGVWSDAGIPCPITLGPLVNNNPERSGLQLESATSNEVVNSSVYPNPISKNNQLMVALTDAQSVKVVIIDVVGKLVYQNEYSNVSSFEISLSELQIQPGIYNISIINVSSNNIQNQKIVVTE